MTRPRVSHIRDSLTSLISPQLIRRRARDLGVVKRQRKVDVVALVYTLVLGFDRGAKRSLASLRRTYASCSGVTLAPSAFYDRFTPQLAELMKQLTVCAFDRLRHSSSRLKRTLAAFTKVFLADGSVIRLHPDLEDHYPSVWTNHMKASAKLHVVMDGATRTPEILRIVPGSSHDVTLMSAGPWCRGTLFIFDLAHYPYRHIPERDWTFRHLRLRLIAVWWPDLKRHRLYLTNASTSQLDAQTAPAVYALRWEIELLFRELKSQLRIEDMPSGNKAATECLLYSALLALAMGRHLHRVLNAPSRGNTSTTRRRPMERWTTLLRTVAPLLLELLLGPSGRRVPTERRLAAVLTREAPDPNRRRLLLLDRAQAGVLQVDLAAA